MLAVATVHVLRAASLNVYHKQYAVNKDTLTYPTDSVYTGNFNTFCAAGHGGKDRVLRGGLTRLRYELKYTFKKKLTMAQNILTMARGILRWRT